MNSLFSINCYYLAICALRDNDWSLFTDDLTEDLRKCAPFMLYNSHKDNNLNLSSRNKSLSKSFNLAVRHI